MNFNIFLTAAFLDVTRPPPPFKNSSPIKCLPDNLVLLNTFPVRSLWKLLILIYNLLEITSCKKYSPILCMLRKSCSMLYFWSHIVRNAVKMFWKARSGAKRWEKFLNSIYTSGNEPKSRKLERRAPGAKRQAKLSKQTAPNKSEKTILELDKK